MEIRNLIDLVSTFRTEEECLRFLGDMRGEWNPYSNGKVWRCKGGRLMDSVSKRTFTIKTGTIYEGSKVPLLKWFACIGLMCSVKKGLSSHQMALEIGVSQPTAWHMMMKVRCCMSQVRKPYEGVVMVDEVYLVPQTRKEHRIEGLPSKKGKNIIKKQYPIFSMISEEGKIHLNHVPHTDITNIHSLIKKYIDPTATIVHDEYKTYKGLVKRGCCREVKVVNHSKWQFTTPDGYTTNPVENMHKHLRSFVRSHNNSHVAQGFYLQRYLDHYVWLWNREHKSFHHSFMEGVRITIRAFN